MSEMKALRTKSLRPFRKAISSFLEDSQHTLWVLLIALIVLPLLISKPLATEIIIFGLFAMGFNLLLGYTGVLSFGHAMYFGLGAYSTGMSLRYLSLGVGASLSIAVLTGVLSAGVVGIVSMKKRGVYFAMISMAFAQMCYFLALTPLARWTGGEDGLKSIPKLTLDFPFRMDLTNNMSLYYFVFFVGGGALIAIHRIVDSPFGHALRAIRENEDRISACGYDTLRIKMLSLIFSGSFSALAGGLYTVYLGYVPISTLFWLLSGSILMMTLLGGTKVFVGPIVGVAVFLFMQNTISLYTDRWQFFVGVIFMIIVMVFPEGIMGTLQKRFASRRGYL
jgi:branched-chain amino acid transport system permease protein